MPFLDPYRATLQKFYPFLSNFLRKCLVVYPISSTFAPTNEQTNKTGNRKAADLIAGITYLKLHPQR